MGVDVGGDADVGVAEEFLNDDEVDALLQEQGRGRVPEVVEADTAEPGPVAESAEAAGEVGGVEGSAGRGGEDEPAVRPVRFGGSPFLLLLCSLGSRWSSFTTATSRWTSCTGRARPMPKTSRPMG